MVFHLRIKALPIKLKSHGPKLVYDCQITLWRLRKFLGIVGCKASKLPNTGRDEDKSGGTRGRHGCGIGYRARAAVVCSIACSEASRSPVSVVAARQLCHGEAFPDEATSKMARCATLQHDWSRLHTTSQSCDRRATRPGSEKAHLESLSRCVARMRNG